MAELLLSNGVLVKITKNSYWRRPGTEQVFGPGDLVRVSEAQAAALCGPFQPVYPGGPALRAMAVRVTDASAPDPTPAAAPGQPANDQK